MHLHKFRVGIALAWMCLLGHSITHAIKITIISTKMVTYVYIAVITALHVLLQQH